MDSYKNYQQGLAKQIRDLIGEVNNLLKDGGGDLVCEPLSMACELLEEAVPYCIENGVVSDAYIITHSVQSAFAEMGRGGFVPEDDEAKLLLLRLRNYSYVLEDWENKGSCPQSMIREAKETGEKIDWSIADVINGTWPPLFRTDDAIKMLKALVDNKVCSIKEDSHNLFWEFGEPPLYGWTIDKLCRAVGYENTPWKMMIGLIIHPDVADTPKDLSKIRQVTQRDNPDGYKKIKQILCI